MVQDLVTLCLTAAPGGAVDPWSSHWDDTPRTTCALDDALPFPAEGARLQGLP